MKRNLKKAIRLLREANENIWEARVLLKDYDAQVNTTSVAIPYGIETLATELGESVKTTTSPFGGTDATFEVEGIKFVEYGVRA